MTTIGSDLRTHQIPTQEMADAITATARAQGLSEAQVAKLQLALQGLLGKDPSSAPPLDAPPGDALRDAEQIGQLNGALGGAGDNMKADIYQFMAIFMKYAQEARKSARTEREVQLQAEVSARESAAREMEKAADARFAAACVEGACQIGAGALSIGASVMQGKHELAAQKSQGNIDALDKEVGRGATLSRRMLETRENMVQNVAKETASAEKWKTAGLGGADLIKGSGKMIGGGLEFSATGNDTAKMRAENEAKVREELRSKENDQMQQMQDIIRDIRDKLAAIEQSNIEANRTISGNIR